jgi:signal transduction histidine kinase
MNIEERPWMRQVLFMDRRYRATILKWAGILSLVAAVFIQGIEFLCSRYVIHLTTFSRVISENNLPKVFALVTILIMFSTFIVFGLIISNRLAGPFFRMRRHMDSVTEGRVQAGEFHFRQQDFFVEVGESYNRLLQVIQAQRQRIDQLENNKTGS